MITQNFEFETDELDDFKQMLETTINILFKHSNSGYTKLHLKKLPSYYWEDGSEYKWSDRGIIDMGSIYSIKPCAIYHGAKQYKILNQHLSLADAAKEANECKMLPPTRLWAATLADSAHSFKEGVNMICARCKKEWAGDSLFITCPSCRMPDRPNKKQKRGCKRFAQDYHNKSDKFDSSPWQENNIRCLEDG